MTSTTSLILARGIVCEIVSRYLPILGELKAYKPSWLTGDLAAAVTVWAIVVPESMAYASVAGLPAQAGLYAATVPLLIYAFLGSSRRVTVGPSAAVAALSFATIAPFATSRSDEFIAYSLLLAMVVGVVLVIAGLFKLGVIADFLSEPVLKGFIVGVALTVALGQLGKLFGYETEGDGFFAELVDFISKLPETNRLTLLLGLASIAALYLLEKVMPRIPGALVVVIGAIVAVNQFDLAERGVAVAGEIPSGLPTLVVPELGVGVLAALIPGAIGVAIVVYGESMALMKTFGSKHRERVDANQELVALGGANIAGGLFGAFTVNASNSRSAAADSAGQNTQVSSFIVFALMIATLLFLTGLFEDLPEAALGAIVIHAVAGLIRFKPIRRLAERNRVDFAAAVLTLIGVLIFDVLAGLLIGVLVSLAGLMRRAARPRITWLAHDDDAGRYRNRDHVGSTGPDGISIVLFGEELFFANVGTLRDAVIEEVDSIGPRFVILDSEAITDIDTTAADELLKLDEELRERNVELVFARMGPKPMSDLELAGFDLSGREYPYIRDAVADLSVEE